MSARPEVRVGQVWESCDPRDGGWATLPRRRVTVLAVDSSHATCQSNRGPTTRIRLDRFKPGSTGWKLVSEGGAA